jgi:hypothetical protein
MFCYTGKDFESFWHDVVLGYFPKAKLKYKDESWFMKLLGKLLFFVPGFMTRFTTTIGTTVYFPSRKWVEDKPDTCMAIISHEFIHMWDRGVLLRRYKLDLFSLGWLSPQIFGMFSLLSVLAMFDLRFLSFLSFLIFTAPWSSKWRTHWESNGYAMTMIFYAFTSGIRYNAQEAADSLSEEFTSRNYYWMCRDKTKVVAMLLDKYATFTQTHDGVKEVYKWLKSRPVSV